MKVVILAGGLGTRLSEETDLRPKPMVEIGGRPILWHIMKHYAHHGLNEVVIALGYKAQLIKRYFLDYYAVNGDFTVRLGSGEVRMRNRHTEDWIVHLIDTGLHTNTGGRVAALRHLIGDETFLLTYGDGVSDIDVRELIAFHERHGLLATVTAVRPPARFGGMLMDGDRVAEFTEKPQIGEGWINGGFMVLEPGVLDYLDGTDANLERDGLERLAEDGQLAAYRHDLFWQCMDTKRDVAVLEGLWQSGKPPWKNWDD
jgi:glucose-1-phosphate cytidylyltransferase